MPLLKVGRYQTSGIAANDAATCASGDVRRSVSIEKRAAFGQAQQVAATRATLSWNRFER